VVQHDHTLAVPMRGNKDAKLYVVHVKITVPNLPENPTTQAYMFFISVLSTMVSSHWLGYTSSI